MSCEGKYSPVALTTTVNSDLGGWQPVYITITGICKWSTGPGPIFSSFRMSFLFQPRLDTCVVVKGAQGGWGGAGWGGAGPGGGGGARGKCAKVGWLD